MTWAIFLSLVFVASALVAAADALAGVDRPRVYVAFAIMLFLAIAAGEAWQQVGA